MPPQNNEQFHKLNAKLDKILAMVASLSSGNAAATAIVEDIQETKAPEEQSAIPEKKTRKSKKPPLPV